MVEIDLEIREQVILKEIQLEKINSVVESLLMEEITSKVPLYVSILITDNAEIAELNRAYREKDGPTDVISFAYHDNEEVSGPVDVLGDIIISYDKIVEQAETFMHSIHREFFYLLIHGLLHLCGYDHLVDEDKKKMRMREEYYYEKLTGYLEK